MNICQKFLHIPKLFYFNLYIMPSLGHWWLFGELTIPPKFNVSAYVCVLSVWEESCKFGWGARMEADYEQGCSKLRCIKRKTKDDRIQGKEFFHHPHSVVLVYPPKIWVHGP